MTQIDISRFNRANRPTREQLVSMSEHLVRELEGTLGTSLSCFKRHIVEGESCVSTTQGRVGFSDVLCLCVEAVVLIKIRTDAPPKINAELLLFSRDERIGVQRHNGLSYLLMDFDCAQESNKWTTQGWIDDGPDDWGTISSPRYSLYSRLEESWEGDD